MSGLPPDLPRLVILISWKKDAENDKHFHAHRNSLADIEQRARDKRNKKKVEKTIDDQVPDSLTEKKLKN